MGKSRRMLQTHSNTGSVAICYSFITHRPSLHSCPSQQPGGSGLICLLSDNSCEGRNGVDMGGAKVLGEQVAVEQYSRPSLKLRKPPFFFANSSSFPAPFPRSFQGVYPFLSGSTQSGSICLQLSFLAATSCPFSLLLHPRWHSQSKHSFHEVHSSPPTRDPSSSSVTPPTLLPLHRLRSSGPASLSSRPRAINHHPVPAADTGKAEGKTLETPPIATP